MLAKSLQGMTGLAAPLLVLGLVFNFRELNGQDLSVERNYSPEVNSTIFVTEPGIPYSASNIDAGQSRLRAGASNQYIDLWKADLIRTHDQWKIQHGQRLSQLNDRQESGSRMARFQSEVATVTVQQVGGTNDNGLINAGVQGGSPTVGSPSGDSRLTEALDGSLIGNAPQEANIIRQGYDPAVPDYFDLDLTSPYAIPQNVVFGPGFQIQSTDEQFRLQIHYESQVEGRLWTPEEQLPANSGFFLPRQRFFFAGNITKVTEYELAINRGVNNINLLNAFFNFRFSERFMIRMGRFFTPLFYEQYAVSNYWLLTPERSIFTTNLSTNRQIGVMVRGYLFDKRLDYAAGFFNGSRNSFESLNRGADFVGYLNARPFQNSNRSVARNLNVGTSIAIGNQDQAPVPSSFRVGGGSPDANIPGVATVPFLILNPGVREDGERLLGSVHLAYFYRSLTLMGEWQYGYGNYSRPNATVSDKIDFGGFYFQVGYFLTGEEIQRRTRVTPLNPFAPLDSEKPRGTGAWEVVSRVSQVSFGDEVFSSGLADRELWSNVATTTEVGVNWYLNDYLKLYACLLHASFSDPIQYRTNRFQKHADLFWLRGQLYF